MSKPEIRRKSNAFLFTWKEERLEVTVSRLHQHRDGRVTGELLIKTTTPGVHSHLHQAQFNFTSSNARRDLSRYLNERYPLDWGAILEQLSVYTLQEMRQGEPLEELWTTDDVTSPEYLLAPLLPQNMPTIIYGEGGVCKSYLAILMAILVKLPWTDNPFALDTLAYPTETLYLDYETDKAEITWRLKCLQKGLGLPDFNLYYRRCILPLYDDLEQVQQCIESIDAKLIIVDSLGAACGGNMNEAETAIKLFGAIRQLGITSLLISHTAKDQTSRTRTVFGSTYFFNFSRSIFEVRKVQEVGDIEISVGLFHRKSNISRLHTPVGFKISFDTDAVVVKSEDVGTVGEFIALLSNSSRIYEVLKDGQRTIPEIANECEISQTVTKTTLYRMRSQGKVIRTGDKWGILETTLVE